MNPIGFYFGDPVTLSLVTFWKTSVKSVDLLLYSRKTVKINRKFMRCWKCFRTTTTTTNHIERCNLRFLTISSLHLKLSLTLTLSHLGAIVCKSCAAHRTLITCNMLYASWYEGTAQLLSLRKFSWHLFQLYFNGWTMNCIYFTNCSVVEESRLKQTPAGREYQKRTIPFLIIIEMFISSPADGCF